MLAGKLIGSIHDRLETRRLDQLFDGPHLREWWAQSGIQPSIVPHLNHAHTGSTIGAFQADLIVRVSGGVLKRQTFGRARIAALNIHHGMAPRIRGMWSISWGIIEGRRDWIGATLHEIDDGIDTGRVLWRGSPQISPGDTATTPRGRALLSLPLARQNRPPTGRHLASSHGYDSCSSNKARRRAPFSKGP